MRDFNIMKKYDNRPIGVFDSGLGGLTVAAALTRRLPDEDIIYLGDTAHVPYGDKSRDTIVELSCSNVDFLLKHDVKLCIAACNTVSAVALDELRRIHPERHIIGVIESGVRAVADSGAGRVAVIATRATVNSHAYCRGIHAACPGVKVESIACPLLVPLAEEGIFSGVIIREVLDIYLKKLKDDPPDAVLLGCTHYPLLRQAIDEYFGGRCSIIDSAVSCAEFAAGYLDIHGLAAAPSGNGRKSFFVTDFPAEFHLHAGRFLGNMPEKVEKVTLDS